MTERKKKTTEKKAKKEVFTVAADKIVDKIKTIITEGNVRRITIKNDKGTTLVVIPLTVAVIGTVLAPVLAAVGALAALVTRCTIVVERRE
jgi:hypothetical protein